jgi:hypothetical protein
LVAGAATGKAYVYSARTGMLLRMYQLGAPPATCINNVVVTTKAAYLTDSRQPVLHRVPIGPRGGRLVAVQSVNGQLYRINPRTGVAR